MATSARTTQLTAAFERTFGQTAAEVMARAPGRVNLIGEHLDYNGLPVLPMTLQREVRVLFGPVDGAQVHLANTDPVFPRDTFSLDPGDGDSPPNEPWARYVHTALRGVRDAYGLTPAGMALLVDGDLPMEAGLSSSTALVVTSALAYLQQAGAAPDSYEERLKLADVLAQAERGVGTQSGGMDQAILLLGGEHGPMKVDFAPLRAEPVPLPEEYQLVVCNSMRPAAKSGSAQDRYNVGPLACRMILALVEDYLQREFDEDIEVDSLAELWMGHLCLTHDEAEDVLNEAIPEAPMTVPEVAERVGTPIEQFVDTWLGDTAPPPFALQLRGRARHQIREFRRVELTRDLLLAGDVEAVGPLMLESHKSLAEDYEVSCEELDYLVDTAMKAGAIGARLTGAGFGGCTVNLVHRDDVDEFASDVTQLYHRQWLGRDPVKDAVLPVEPSPAAGYVRLD